MAEQSQFSKYIQKYFTGFVATVTKLLNGVEEGENTETQYRYKKMLITKQSMDGKWSSILSDNKNVAADVVAMDSPLPLKSRPALETASGDIPKLGMEMKMNENQLDQLDTLIAKQADINEIVGEIFDDAKRGIVGVEEQKEYLFLRGLSSGVALTTTDNVGAGIRVDFKYPAANKAGVPVLWTDLANSSPISDVNNLIAKAKRKISLIMIDKVYFDLARRSAEGRDLYARSVGNYGTSQPIPTASQFLEAWQGETSAVFDIVDRSVDFEVDGDIESVKAWDEGKVILLTKTVVGNLVWKKVTEANHQSKSIDYKIVDGHILVSKYVTHKPFGEWTDVQARAVPIINGVRYVYQLDAKTVQA